MSTISNNAKYITVGYHREDGDIDPIASFVVSNCQDEAAADDLRNYARQMAHEFGAEIFERQDLPDTVVGEDAHGWIWPQRAD